MSAISCSREDFAERRHWIVAASTAFLSKFERREQRLSRSYTGVRHNVLSSADRPSENCQCAFFM